MDKKLNKPTDAELEILHILWTKGESTVREVHNELSKVKESAYTTTLKLMQIMLGKGLLRRNSNNKSHIYCPVFSEDDIQKGLLRKLMETAYAGSTSKLVLQALGNHKTSREELEEIKKLIIRLEKGS
ncbi:MAG: BlaI/MecI/CopY family transcriptional regulator [Melioribacteraceae bacterium]|nr:BlaI/MecI/CopY family transcriptional regulator [Melioribacteraceae bacterium]